MLIFLNYLSLNSSIGFLFYRTKTTATDVPKQPTSYLFLSPPELSACIFGAILRDTQGVLLSDSDRVNHFPASPIVSVTCVSAGSLKILRPGEELEAAREKPPQPKMFVTPPQERPLSSWSEGEVRAITLGVYPDAWLELGGDRDYRHVPQSIMAALNLFSSRPPSEFSWSDTCDLLLPDWSEVRPPHWHNVFGFGDWIRSVIARVAMTEMGRSVRTFERRLKRTSGQTQSDLNFFQAFDKLREVAHKNPDGLLSELALEAGYADQSHMGRVVKRATGFSPAHLRKAIASEEPFWCYRLLGEEF